MIYIFEQPTKDYEPKIYKILQGGNDFKFMQAKWEDEITKSAPFPEDMKCKYTPGTRKHFLWKQEVQIPYELARLEAARKISYIISPDTTELECFVEWLINQCEYREVQYQFVDQLNMRFVG